MYIGVHIIYKILNSKTQIASKNLQPRGFFEAEIYFGFVKLTFGWVTSASPAVCPYPNTMFSTPGGSSI